MSSLRYVRARTFVNGDRHGAVCALVEDADSLNPKALVRVAHALGAPETAFALTARRDDCAARLRVCTPRRELPLGAHAVHAATALLAHRYGDETAYELGVVRVGVRRADEVSVALPRTVLGRPVEDRRSVTDALGLVEDELDETLPITPGTSAVSVLLVPVRDRAALERAALQPLLRARAIEKAKVLAATMFVPHARHEPWRARTLWAGGSLDEHGGSLAAGPMALYALRHRGISRVTFSARCGPDEATAAPVQVSVRGDGTDEAALSVRGRVEVFSEGTLRA